MRKGRGSNDHLSSSLTDLMTSLMVIFVLLLVTKLNNQAGGVKRAVEYVVNQLKAQPQLFRDGEQIRQEGDVIVVVIPEKLMSFRQAAAERGGADLSVEGREYLKRTVPKLSETLCRPDIIDRIDTIVVEGHSDPKGFGAEDEKLDKQKNLELSQQRSMSVVAESMTILEVTPAFQRCFLDLLSATGRGDAHPIDSDPYSPKNRRVEFRIRVRPEVASEIKQLAGGTIRK